VSSSCLAPPDAGQSATEDVTGLVPVDVAGALAGVRARCGTLAEYLDQVVDHRSRQGLRYDLGFLLAVVVAATSCAGHDEVSAQAQWAADAPAWVLRALGAEPDPLTGAITAPSESTLRHALAKVDAADLQRLTAQWAL
jgi:DDE_Tnp_1-associated